MIKTIREENPSIKMDIKKSTLLLLLSVMVIPLFSAAKKENDLKILPQHHKDWLEQDVSYITTPKEKEIFLKLESNRERDIFIEAFWKQRDPTPGTPVNEFKEEHYRRMAYANEYFGRETTRPGWQTDRGRIYIILGPPLDIGRYEGQSFARPARIWSYKGNPDYGLPSYFNLIFFKRKGMGEYVLYSPTQDGPASLLTNYRGDPTNRWTAYQQLRKFEPRLAETSLSLIPGESISYGHPSLASEILLNQINSVPEKTIDWEYAEALLKYKDFVEVEYTANYVKSDSKVEVIQDESGIFFLHYSIQPEKLSVLSYQEKYSINFALNGMVTDSNGNMIFQYEKTFPLSFNRDQIEDVQKTSIVIQDMIPLIEGNHKFSLLLKNTVSKEFTSLEENISIPPKLPSLGMSSILLGYKLTKDVSQQNANKPFKIRNHQIACQAGNIFHPKENLVIFSQIYGLTNELHETGTVTFTFYKKGEEFLKKEKSLKELVDNNIIEEFPLQNFSPDYFKVKVSISDGSQKVILSDEKNFEISPLPDLPRPWVVSKVLPSSQDSIYFYILGNQLSKKGHLGEAEKLLERAYNKRPTSLEYAMSYSGSLFKKKEYLKAKNILIPFSKDPQKNFQSLSLLAACSQALGEYEEAISFYKEYLSHAGTQLNTLNSIGQCYYRLGNTQEALIAWEKSLEIDPNQENLRKIVDQLKKKN